MEEISDKIFALVYILDAIQVKIQKFGDEELSENLQKAMTLASQAVNLILKYRFQNPLKQEKDKMHEKHDQDTLNTASNNPEDIHIPEKTSSDCHVDSTIEKIQINKDEASKEKQKGSMSKKCLVHSRIDVDRYNLLSSQKEINPDHTFRNILPIMNFENVQYCDSKALTDSSLLNPKNSRYRPMRNSTDKINENAAKIKHAIDPVIHPKTSEAPKVVLRSRHDQRKKFPITPENQSTDNSQITEIYKANHSNRRRSLNDINKHFVENNPKGDSIRSQSVNFGQSRSSGKNTAKSIKQKEIKFPSVRNERESYSSYLMKGCPNEFESEKDILRKKILLLKDQIDARDIVDYFYQAGVIEFDDKIYISKKHRLVANDELLGKIIRSTSGKAFGVLLNVLIDRYPCVAKQLLDESNELRHETC